MSLASTLFCSALAAAMASTPVPVPTSSTRRGQVRLQHLVEQQQAAARGAVMAGAERQRRLDLDADLVGRHFCAVVLAVHDKTPGADRRPVLQRGLDPVLGLDRVEGDVPVRPRRRRRGATSSRIESSSGGSAKCIVMSQRPPGPSYAAIAAWPSKKLSFSRSTTRLAACSLPIAKLARRVAGVMVEVIKGSGEDGADRASLRSLSVSNAGVVR